MEFRFTGISEAQRQAIVADPKWRAGRYDLADPPAAGPKIYSARAIGDDRLPSLQSGGRVLPEYIPPMAAVDPVATEQAERALAVLCNGGEVTDDGNYEIAIMDLFLPAPTPPAVAACLSYRPLSIRQVSFCV